MKTLKETLRDFFKLFLIFGLPFILLAIGLTIESKTDAKIWNNGICIECNEEMQFSGASHLRSGGKLFYYTCENCGHTIEVHSIRK